jgi:diguanylate cyclase (GGDEF)-like protein
LQEVQVLQEATTALQSRAEQLEDATRRDALTGVFNRAWLDQELERELILARNANRPLSIALVELDQLKGVRERLGQEAVNTVLCHSAKILHSCIRDSDAVVRYSAEEFLVLLPGADPEAARQVCNRMLASMRETQCAPNGEPLPITVSIGIASRTSQRSFETTAAFLEGSDHALYAAKLRGRNRAESVDELPPGSTR